MILFVFFIVRIPIGKYHEALVYYQEALAGQEEVLGAEHPDTKKTKQYIVQTEEKLYFYYCCFCCCRK